MPDPRPPLLTRGLRRGHLVAIDAVLAVGLAALLVYAIADRASTRHFDGPTWLGIAVACALGLPVAVRRLWPLTVLTAALLALAIATWTGMAWGQSGIPFLFPLMLTLYVIGLDSSRRAGLIALGACLLGTTTVLITTATDPADLPWGTPGSFIFDWLLLAVPLAAGRAVRARRDYATSATESLARQAVTDERLRIARELHDIVAHSLSLITVKAAVANHVAAQHPAEARDALRIIEDTSRGTLTDMRRLLGVLRSPEITPSLAPAPGLAGLPDLAERAGLAGVHVELDVVGDTVLPDGVGLSVYRIVQEALTNVVKHAAPARCTVSVTTGPAEVLIDIVDDGPGVRTLPRPTTGHGLVGMRERVALYDGEFTAGPRAGGGFAVSARLPYELAPAS